MSWYRPAGSLATDGARVLVTPEDAGWTYSGLRVVDLANKHASLLSGQSVPWMRPGAGPTTRVHTAMFASNKVTLPGTLDGPERCRGRRSHDEG